MAKWTQPFSQQTTPQTTYRPPFNDSLDKQRTLNKSFTPAFITSLSRGMSPEEAIAHEHVQFNRWLNLFKTPGKDGKKRQSGSRTIFDNFFQQMMPSNMTYKWLSEEHPYIFVVNTNGGNEQVFQQKGTMRSIFKKLIQHYGNHRREYFQKRYNTVLPKEAFSSIIKKGLAPTPEPTIIEVEKEVIVEKEVKVEVEKEIMIEVPGKEVDTSQKAMETTYEQLMDMLDGNNKLPNKFRHIKDLDVSINMTGFMSVNILFGP
jgi:hypothetical protein